MNTPTYEDELIQRHNRLLHRIIAVAGLLIGGLTVTLSILVQRPAPQPYVLLINRNGEPVGMVQPAPGSTIPDAVIRAALARYIQNIFEVAPYEQEAIDIAAVLAMTTSSALKTLDDWYHINQGENNPANLAAKYWQQANILRTVKVKDTYEVYYETQRALHDDQKIETTEWRAFLIVKMGQPTKDNPLGIYVDSLDFQKEAQ